MSERGQHTRLVIGAAEAEVALFKTSKKPIAARHDVQRITVPMQSTVNPIHVDQTLSDDTPFESTSPSTYTIKGPELPEVVVQHGVKLKDGTFVDLTNDLKAIDERTKIDGMRIEFTVPVNAIPRSWMRDAYYVVPTSPESARFLAYVWEGIASQLLGAIVRWTKQTDQFLCAIVARGAGHLELIQLEWAQNMRPVPTNARLDLAAVPSSGRERAQEAMNALRRPPSALERLRDERAFQRAELLTSARKGRRWVAPEPDVVLAPVTELGETLVAASR